MKALVDGSGSQSHERASWFSRIVKKFGDSENSKLLFLKPCVAVVCSLPSIAHSGPILAAIFSIRPPQKIHSADFFLKGAAVFGAQLRNDPVIEWPFMQSANISLFVIDFFGGVQNCSTVSLYIQ